MAASQVMLYFDKQEEGPVHSRNAVAKVAKEICKPVESRLRVF